LINGVSSLAQTDIDFTTTYTGHTTDFAAIMEQLRRCCPGFPEKNCVSAVLPSLQPVPEAISRCQLPERLRKMNHRAGVAAGDFSGG
jgi:hypothetical protein